MATANRSNKFSYNRNYYEQRYTTAVDGNTARQLEEEYEEEYYSDEEFDEEYAAEDFYGVAPEYAPQTRPAQAPSYEVKIKRKYNFNFAYIAMLLLSVGALLFASIKYLEVHSQINQKEHQLASAKTELNDLLSLNASLKTKLDVEVDRNYIYSVAVSRFHMQYPDSNQTVYYEKPTSGHVRQYQNIPTLRDSFFQ